MKLLLKQFTDVKLKLEKKLNGEIFIDFTPIIDRANELIKQEKDSPYYVFYVKNSTPMVRAFRTEKAAVAFANKHEDLDTEECGDNWVDAIIKGRFVAKYKNWYGAKTP